MWPFKKKKQKVVEEEETEEEDDESQKIPEDAELGNKVEMMGAQLTKINGTLEGMKEMRKSTSERFATMNEQIGELRGTVNDTQRSVGQIEVKATKAADLVESVHPDRLMIQVQKEDGKIEGLRGILEAKEEMMRNIMDQVRKIRDQMNVYRGIEQVIKLNEEVKDELMGIKRISATVERHADRVENVFIEAQKSFQAFNTFSDKLDSLKNGMKELTTKVDKFEVQVQAAVKKNDFDEKMAAVDRYDKRAKKILDDIETYYNKLDEKFKHLAGKIRGEFEFKIEKAEVLSKAFEDTLAKNPLFAQGLGLQEFLKKHMEGGGATAEVKSEGGDAGGEAKEGGGGEGGDEKKEGEDGGEEKKEEASEEQKEGMEKVKE